MKFTTISVLLTLISATIAVPTEIGTREYTEIDARQPIGDGVQLNPRIVWHTRELAEYASDIPREQYTSDISRELGARYLDSSYELSEREYEEIDKRMIGVLIRAAKGIYDMVKAITDQIQADKDMRGRYTSTLVDKMSHQYRHYNFAVCHTSHKLDPIGKEGKDWGHIHHEVDVGFHKTIGYEIYWFKEGTFHRYGDGGYLNWAYVGNVKSTSNGGKDIVFGRRT